MLLFSHALKGDICYVSQIWLIDTVGAEAAQGCDPVTITDHTVDGDTVTVPEAVLQANEKRFSNWKEEVTLP